MKKNIKKIISVIATTLTITTVLSGCGASSNSKKTSDSDVTLTYTIWDKAQEPGMRSMVEAFEEKNPGIKVSVEVTPWDQYWTKLEAGASAGTMPDVFWMHSNQQSKFASNGVLLDITDRIEKSSIVDMNMFPEDLVELYKDDGKNYAIPKDVDTVGLWYNKTMFDEAGISYPDETWTWDTLLDAAKKLTNSEKGIYGFSAPLNFQEGIDNFIYQNGGEIISEDKKEFLWNTPEVKEAVEWYVDLSLKEHVSPTQKQFSEYSSVSLLESGKCAMSLHGSWNLSEFLSNDYVRENCNVSVLPKQKEQASIFNGLGNAISVKTSHPEEAWKFVEFLGSQEANKIQAESGTAIPAYEGTREEWVNLSKDFNLQVFIDMLDYAKIRPYSKETVKWETIETQVLTKAFTGESPVSDVCDEVAEKVTEVLNSED